MKNIRQNQCLLLFKTTFKFKRKHFILDNERLGIDDYQKFKESEIERNCTNQNKEQEKITKFTKLISIFAIALISILSLLSLSLYRNNIIRNKSNLLLQDKKTRNCQKTKPKRPRKRGLNFINCKSWA
jgi:hypothetical protein